MDSVGATEIEKLLGNIIRAEIGIAERKQSNIIETSTKEQVFVTTFGFHEKCNENIEDSYIWPGAPEPASKCPNTEGKVFINLENVLKIAQTNYTILIKYKYNENIYDFI